jgi:hypothetical protein
MNRSQQTYFINKGKFARKLEQLQLDIKPQTEKFIYSMKFTEKVIFNYAIPRKKYQSNSWLDRRLLRGYVGFVYHVNNLTQTNVCEMAQPAINTIPPDSVLKDGVFTCAPGTTPLIRYPFSGTLREGNR